MMMQGFVIRSIRTDNYFGSGPCDVNPRWVIEARLAFRFPTENAAHQFAYDSRLSRLDDYVVQSAEVLQ